MDPERWKRIEEIYHSALEHEPGGRTAFLAEACHSDADLRREVEGLLAQPTPRKPGNSGGGKGPYFRCAFEEGEER